MISPKNLLLSVSLSVLLFAAADAQTHGKLFSKDEADKLFGPVLESVQVDTEIIKGFIAKHIPALMFKIIDKDIVILDDKRNVLFSRRNEAISKEAVFHMYSNTVVQELINRGGSPVTYIEKRQNVMSVTNGATTMEMAATCPPFCE